MTKMLENEMVRPYADDEPIPERKEREYDKYRDSIEEDFNDDFAELKAEFLRIARVQGK